MVMAVAECSDDRIAVPFHIRQADGTWDRSRTWLITRNDAGGLRLKHDHRHEDGESDAVTMYGGDTAQSIDGGDTGTARAQSFPVDAESVAMFEREGLTDHVIVVTRWYGGKHLGGDRFRHVQDCVRHYLDNTR